MDKRQIMLLIDLNEYLVGEEGLEPSRLAAHDPKSCSSANSDIPPESSPGHVLKILSPSSGPTEGACLTM